MSKNNQVITSEDQNNIYITDPLEVADDTVRPDGQFKGQLSIEDM